MAEKKDTKLDWLRFLMDNPEYPMLIFFWFMIFFVNGYILHGVFLGFKPLDPSQVLICLAIGFFVAIPLLFLNYFIAIGEVLTSNMKIEIIEGKKRDKLVSTEDKRQIIYNQLMYTCSYIYLYDVFVLAMWLLPGEMAPIVDPSIFGFITFPYLLSIIITFKAFKKEEGEFIKAKREHRGIMKKKEENKPQT